MDVARELGMTVAELMVRMTHREFVTWVQALKEPSHDQFYMMQMAYEAHCSMASSDYRKRCKINDFKLKLVDSDSNKQEQSVEDSERIWLSFLGLPADAFGPTRTALQTPIEEAPLEPWPPNLNA